MDQYIKYKVQLEKFQYPNINTFNDDEIKDLFLPKNGFPLLFWIVNTLNANVTLSAEYSESNESAIADYLYESGFCTKSQRLNFVQRLCSVKEDIIIFDRIFDFLSLTQEDISLDFSENNSEEASVDDFLNKDIKLFPFLPTRSYTQKEREQQQAECKLNISKLKAVTNETVPNVTNHFIAEDSSFNENLISSNMESIKERMKHLSRTTSIIRRNSESFQKENCFEECIASDLDTCCNKIESVGKYLSCINLMDSIGNKVNTVTSSQDDEVVEALKCSVGNCSRITKLLQN